MLVPPKREPCIEIQLFEGSKLVKTKTFVEVRAEMIERLKRHPAHDPDVNNLYDYLDGLSCFPPFRDERSAWPEYWSWIACFPVTGSSEGHYIHVEIIGSDKKERTLVYLAKTFHGMDAALEVSAALTKMLGA